MLAELAKRLMMHPGQITAWKDQLLARAEHVLHGGGAIRRSAGRCENAARCKIGELALENDFLESYSARLALLSAKR